MPGRVEIVNYALARLGESPIQALNENSTPARCARQIYDQVRRAVLREFDWSFAICETSLARVEHDGGAYSFVYALPADCLRAIKLREGGAFEVRQSRLYTNCQSAYLIYIKDETDDTRFDSLFVDLLAYKLAAELAIPLAGSSEMFSSYTNMYMGLLSKVGTLSQREARQELSDNPYVEARFV